MRKLLFHLIFIGLAFCLGSCHFFDMERVDKFQVKEAHLNELKEAELKNYPQIGNCDSIQNPKKCFEYQLTRQIQESLHFASLANQINTTSEDTLWLTIQITKEGDIMVLDRENYPQDHHKVITKIDSTLQTLSPVKPAHLNGVKVNCNFRLPVIIK